MKIEILDSNSTSQPYYARIVADNGKILFTSETYVYKSDAENAAKLVKQGATYAQIVDLTRTAASRRW